MRVCSGAELCPARTANEAACVTGLLPSSRARDWTLRARSVGRARALLAAARQVNGQSLEGFTNHEAVELLKGAGGVLRLKFARHERGEKHEQLMQIVGEWRP